MIPSTARHLVIVGGAGGMGAEIAVASADAGDRVTTADLAGKTDKTSLTWRTSMLRRLSSISVASGWPRSLQRTWSSSIPLTNNLSQ